MGQIINSTLFKRAKNGKIQQWSIQTINESFTTTEGYVDGKLTTSKPTVCVGKNIGRSNEKTPEEQALLEATSKIKKKLDSGYVADIGEVDNVVRINPMLAHKWDKYKDKIEGPFAIQPKLDGIRCIATKDGLFTRNGKPIVAAGHIEYAIYELLDGLDDGIVFDGELYNHDLKEDFNKIISLVRKQKPTVDDLVECEEKLQYHIYDVDVPTLHFAQRSATLKQLLEASSIDYLKFVETEFTDNLDDIDDLYADYLERGYEGQMIRKADSEYQNSRSKNLLKRKEFIDEEFKIIDIEEGVGNRSGMMGRIKFEGFDSNARGSHEYWTELLVNKENYIGKMATVRYQNLTPDGIPRFPVMIAIRDYE